jgi:undecaprenyl pyrophosphate phosphatase UppP
MTQPTEQLLLAEVQVLLAEKRTYYAMLRSAIAIATLPLTVIAFLIATVKYHQLFDNLWLSTVVIIVLSALTVVGISFIARANRRIRHINQMIEKIKSSNKRLAEIVLE